MQSYVAFCSCFYLFGFLSSRFVIVLLPSLTVYPLQPKKV
uniref:Uncharacterized protein n=1 Tax=Arundo donax TaxID=35708 RepID=A0A0A9FMZ0_ARUDO